MQKKILIVAAVLEIATGVALLTVASLVGRLLLAAELTGVALPVAHLTGIALIALGIACWLGTPLCGILTYNALATLYFLSLGIRGKWVGPLLWPVVVLHALLALLLAWAWRKERREEESLSTR